LTAVALEFSSETKAKLQKALARYPDAMAATLPALHLAQKEFGHINEEVVELVSREVGVSPAHVWGVATFYTMYNKKPLAKHHVQVCTNVTCMLLGGYECLRKAEAAAAVMPELITVSEVECLAACGTAVCVQINDDYYENVSPARMDSLLEELRHRG
jgi:NADH:ubiquinone oxidoreductase subunit E